MYSSIKFVSVIHLHRINDHYIRDYTSIFLRIGAYLKHRDTTSSAVMMYDVVLLLKKFLHIISDFDNYKFLVTCTCCISLLTLPNTLNKLS